jgi:hypothetical protein
MIHRFAVVVVLLSASAIGQTSHWADAGDQTAQWMIEQERRWAEGPCDHNRVADTILADDFQGTGTDGKRYTKADDLADSDDQSHSATGCKLIEAKVRFFGDNLAIVYGSESRVVNGAGRTQVWTDTWLKRNGRWQIIAAQDGRVSPPEAQKASAKTSAETPLQFLLAAVAKDFHAQRAPRPVGFRDVRLGHVIAADGAQQYLLCGEFLAEREKDKGEWTPFATIKTSGYEQWQGAQAVGFCRRPTIVWHDEGNLSAALQSRFDALR